MMGRPALTTGFSYRMMYVPPERIAQAAGNANRSLPFVGNPVLSDPVLRSELVDALEDIDQKLGDLRLDGILAGLASGLIRNSDAASRRNRKILNRTGLSRAVEFLTANCRETVHSSVLEAVADMDRFSLARQFRAAYGTSPHRFLVGRRLEIVKNDIAAGLSLAEAAASAGFADQSHMSRHFKKSFGMTPGQWSRLLLAGKGVGSAERHWH